MTQAVVHDLLARIKASGVTPTETPEVTELPTQRELPRELVGNLQMFEDLKAIISWADGLKDEQENVIREALDGAKIGTIDGRPVVKVIDSHNSHFDRAKLKAGFPEAYEATLKRVDYDYILTTAPR